MKKLLLTAAVLGTVLLSACEKDEQIVPVEKTLIKADKGILCRGCGDWDINQAESTSLRVSGSVDTTSTVSKPGKTRRNK